MLKILYTLILTLSLNVLLSQTITIDGKVLDETKQPAIGSSVLLLSQKDSSLVKGTVTDINGDFKLENINSNNKYLLKIISLGYKPTYRKIFALNEPINLGTINLKQNLTDLKEVTVEAKNPLATQSGDTTSFKANAYKVNKDANAEDLVGKMPGVTVTDGKVQAQGEDVKQVLVDGKPFFGNDASAVLKNLPAEVIDKVQVFDRKSDQAQFTGFDDGNASKTMNIVTKPQFRNGNFGKVYAGYGYQDKYKAGLVFNSFKGARRLTILAQSNNINEQNFSTEDLAGVMSGGGGNGGQGGGGMGRRGGMGGGGGQGMQNNSDNFLVNTQNGINTTSSFGLNYSDKWKKKTDVTASYFFNWTQNNSTTTLLQQYIIGNNNGMLYNENNTSKSDNFNNRLNLKFETKIDSMNSILFQPRLSFQNNDGKKELLGTTTKSDALLSKSDNQSGANIFAYNISLPVLYRHSFTKRGRTLSVNATPTLTKNDNKSYLYTLNNYYSSLMNDTIDQNANTKKDGNSITGNVTYTEPLNQKNFLLLTYNANYTDNYSSKKTYDYNYTQSSYNILDTNLTNIFGNTYQAHSGSLGYRFQQEKYNLTITGAYQWAELSKAQEMPSNYKLTKNFESVLPSAQFQYKFSQKKNLRVNYRTNNNAPTIDQLQDVVNNTNSLQLSTGNPNLRQDYQHNLFARYSGVNTDKATSFFFLIGGNYSNNYIGNSTLIASVDTTVYNNIYLSKGSQIIRPVNLDNNYSLRSFINYTFPISKIRTNLSINLSGNYSNVPGLINEALNEAQTTSASLGLVFSSNISEKIDFSISSNTSYNNIYNTLQSNSNSIYYNQNSRAKVNITLIKSVVIQTEYVNTYYTGLTSSYNQSISLLNAAIAYKFLKDKNAEFRLSAYDILNQNNNIQRTNTDSYIQDTKTNALNRYFLLTFTYNFKKYFEKKPDNK